MVNVASLNAGGLGGGRKILEKGKGRPEERPLIDDQ
jgi:hypothetical protein